MIGSLDVARRAVEIAADQQAADVVLLDIGRISTFADYFVICTVETQRQTSSLTEELMAGLKTAGAEIHHREGLASSGWVLLDYSDVVVHIFAPEERDHFRLEQLWGEASPLIRIQ